jgi:uncharacterized membrane protein YccF (DUF307 family)
MTHPKSKARAMLGAWTTAAVILGVLWCLLGGVWLAARVVLGVARSLAFG